MPLGDLDAVGVGAPAALALTPLLEQAATRRDRVPIVLHADDTPARCWPLELARPTPARTDVRDELARPASYLLTSGRLQQDYMRTSG
jgi:hypothetical protein